MACGPIIRSLQGSFGHSFLDPHLRARPCGTWHEIEEQKRAGQGRVEKEEGCGAPWCHHEERTGGWGCCTEKLGAEGKKWFTQGGFGYVGSRGSLGCTWVGLSAVAPAVGNVQGPPPMPRTPEARRHQPAAATDRRALFDSTAARPPTLTAQIWLTATNLQVPSCQPPPRAGADRPPTSTTSTEAREH